MMNISLSKKAKRMGFKEFVKKFGKFFKSIPEKNREAVMKVEYTKATGKKPVESSKPKKED